MSDVTDEPGGEATGGLTPGGSRDEVHRAARWLRLTVPNRTWTRLDDLVVLHRLGHNSVVRRDTNGVLLFGNPWTWQVRRPSSFYEEDEPVEDLVAAFERGTPTIIGPPVYTTVGHLDALDAGTLLRAVDPDVALLAWRVTTTRWAVTGYCELRRSSELLELSRAWRRVDRVEVDP